MRHFLARDARGEGAPFSIALSPNRQIPLTHPGAVARLTGVGRGDIVIWVRRVARNP